ERGAAAVEGPQRSGHPAEQLGLAQLGIARRSALDPARDQALRLGELEHGLGRDPKRMRGPRRLQLGITVDAEQIRVLAAQAHDVVAAARPHLEVPVGDAAFEWFRAALDRSEPLLENLGHLAGHQPCPEHWYMP